VTEYEMDRSRSRRQGPDGVTWKSFDATELFEARWLGPVRQALRRRHRRLRSPAQEFSDSRYTKAALYNCGLAHQGKKEGSGDPLFKVIIDHYEATPDAKDRAVPDRRVVRRARELADLGGGLRQILQRKGLTAGRDHIEALGRRGSPQFKLKDLETAERTFRRRWPNFQQIEVRGAPARPTFLSRLCKYHLGEIPTSGSRRFPAATREADGLDLEEKARRCCSLSASTSTPSSRQCPVGLRLGFQIASLYEESTRPSFTRPFLRAGRRRHDGKRQIYFEELRKKIRSCWRSRCGFTKHNS